MTVPRAVLLRWIHLPGGRLPEGARPALVRDVDDAVRARMARYRRPEDADRALAAHALLRRAAADVHGGKPADVVVRRRCRTCGTDDGDHGKPYVVSPPGAEAIEVNLTHSGEVAAVALVRAAAPGVQVGVDVEQHRRVDWTALRRSVFADPEWDALHRADDWHAAGFTAWARKEAALKAAGHGLAHPMREAVIRSVAGGWVTLLDAGTVIGCDVVTVPQHAGAVALSMPPEARADGHGTDAPPVVTVIREALAGGS